MYAEYPDSLNIVICIENPDYSLGKCYVLKILIVSI